MKIIKTYIFSTIAVTFFTAMALTVPLQAQTSDEATNTLIRFKKYFKNDQRAEAQKLLDEVLAGREIIRLVEAADYVAKKGEIDMLRQLLDHGVDPNAMVDGDKRPIYKSIIDGAAAEGQVEALRLLLDRGGNPGIALFYGAERKKVKAVELLLSRGAEVNGTFQYKKTPLHATTQKWGSLKAETTLATAGLLINQGADVNALTYNKQTPLYFATKYYPTVVQLLLEHGADPNLNADLALFVDDEEKVLLVRMLLEAGADPNIKFHYGGRMRSPLELPIQKETKLKELLREYGATIQGKSRNIQET